jgi:hypothetical protein
MAPSSCDGHAASLLLTFTSFVRVQMIRSDSKVVIVQSVLSLQPVTQCSIGLVLLAFTLAQVARQIDASF